MNKNSINICCLGDIAPINKAYDYIIKNESLHKESFNKLFSDYDIVFGNLETPITNRDRIREDKMYNFKTDRRALDGFPQNFIFSIANNHILDYGNEGLLDTVDNLKKEGFRFTGAGENLDQAGEPVIIACKGKKVGFLAAASEDFGAATEDNPGVFPDDSDLLTEKIKQLKRKTDIIYLSIHNGKEYISVPTPAMKKLASDCHGAGADVIFFHHAHCVSGYTLKNTKATLWGTGNFIFPRSNNYPLKSWYETASWQFSHNADSGLDLLITPYKLSKYGLPEEAEKATREKVLKGIEFISNYVNQGKKLERLIWRKIFKISYLRTAFSRYSDVARRRGIKSLLIAILFSIKSLLRKHKHYYGS